MRVWSIPELIDMQENMLDYLVDQSVLKSIKMELNNLIPNLQDSKGCRKSIHYNVSKTVKPTISHMSFVLYDFHSKHLIDNLY